MGQKRTSQFRESNPAHLNLYSSDTTRGWRIVRETTLVKGEGMCASGKWQQVFDPQGDLAGYQILATFKTDQDLPSGASSSAITENENRMNAGVCGTSHTASMGSDEDARMSRRNCNTGKALPPEDAVERAQVKVASWPYPASRIDNGKGKPIYGDRATRVYPKVS